VIPKDAQTRKALPITSGVLDYFPDALLEVARCSKVGNDQHNPDQPLHWAKEKSTDEADALVRHLLEEPVNRWRLPVQLFGKVPVDEQRCMDSHGPHGHPPVPVPGHRRGRHRHGTLEGRGFAWRILRAHRKAGNRYRSRQEARAGRHTPHHVATNSSNPRASGKAR